VGWSQAWAGLGVGLVWAWAGVGVGWSGREPRLWRGLRPAAGRKAV